ncbi:MAG: retroviral-like aspartic protease [Anaerolineales bacterium]|nr:retroviral-like aspartic protease [Anaerolineales bacterium]MCB8939399.1 retroviral-like aspartic protease [Ardenticatenaceae bacterium]
MPKYDAALFDPPAPLAQVVLRNPQNAEQLASAPMLLDSGADVTLVPTQTAGQLNLAAEFSRQYELRGFDGSRTMATAVQLEMIFLNKIFRGRFLLIDQVWGILGRDILNLVSLSLDGPNQFWAEQSSG